jgi:hypothetical protein
VAIAKAQPTVTFGAAPTPTYLGGNFTVSASTTNTDSAVLTYSAVSGPCALVSGATFSSSGAGSCAVQASGVATTNFLAASAQQTVTIAKAASTTTFGAAPTPTYLGGNFTVNASNNSGGTITYSYVSGPCALVNASLGTFSSSGAGSCVVKADSATTTNYLASSAQQTVTIAKAQPTITFGAAPTPTYLGGNFTVSATTTNTDSPTLTYSAVSGPCALVSGATFSSSGAGTCKVQASGTATTNFLAASNTQDVTIAKAASTTSFGAAPTPTYGDNFTVSASNNSTGTITYSVVSGPCTLMNASLGTFSSTGAGSCVVKAYSATTMNYLASSAQQTVTISTRPVTVKATSISRVFGQSTPVFSIYTSVGTLASGDTLASLGTPTFTTSPTNPAVNVGSYTIAVSGLSNSNYTITYDNTGSLTITQVGTTSAVSVTPVTQQYSDRVTFSATLSPAIVGGQSPATSVTFFVGTPSLPGAQNMGTCTLAVIGGALSCQVSNVALLEPAFPPPAPGNMAPGAHTVYAVFGGVNANFTVGTPTTSLTITQENALVAYSGLNFFWTASITSTSVSVPLRATIQDVSDGAPGDIRNATVRFVSRDVFPAVTLCTATVTLINPADTTTATASCTPATQFSVDNTGSTQYTIGIVVEGYYTRDDSLDDTLVTVSQPLANFITGGGYLVLSQSAGLVPGNTGSKINFGHNVKYNSNLTNLQGHVNIILRNGGHVYQIKSTSITTLGVTTNAVGGQGQFLSKANIQDITNPVNPISVEGNATLQFNMVDNGEPGSSDTLGITVWNKAGLLWFSSNWSGSPPATVQQVLGGGNLAVH